ncbi:hypothetical protein AMECASPLE_000388 [Ameca splendens]|uniref:Secreted protein n=1 Tax=Ameca splendens TaxID=208324 RepID=A0ABV0Y916_9TELE
MNRKSFSIPLLPWWVARELVPISSSLWTGGGVHPGQVASPSQGNTETHSFTPEGDIEKPINLAVMFLSCWRKPEYPERTHTCTGRTCKLHAERPPDLLAARQQCFHLRHHAALE